MILYENGKKEIVIAIMINIFELVKWILFAAIKMESPNREPGMQEKIWKLKIVSVYEKTWKRSY